MIFIFGWCLCIYTVDELSSIVDRFDLLIFLCFGIITINVVAIHTLDRFPWQELFGAIALNLYICYLLGNYLCGCCNTFTVKLTWKKESNIDGYRLYVKEDAAGSSWTKIATITSAKTTTFTQSGLTSNNGYKFQILLNAVTWYLYLDDAFAFIQ